MCTSQASISPATNCQLGIVIGGYGGEEVVIGVRIDGDVPRGAVLFRFRARFSSGDGKFREILQYTILCTLYLF